jgi:hypothetical protein
MDYMDGEVFEKYSDQSQIRFGGVSALAGDEDLYSVRVQYYSLKA